MARVWSKTKQKLENDLLCDSLRGRVKYFMTGYHNAPDKEGRFCVRVDGIEYVQANPYNQNRIYADANRLQKEYNVPHREWEKGHFLFDDENCQIEDIAYNKAMEENRMDMWQVLSAIEEYLNMDIQTAVSSDNAVIRMFAVMDRRVGKRTFMTMKQQINQQPKWLQFFYKLRIEAEE